MPPADDDERISLVDADSVASSSANSGNRQLPEQEHAEQHAANTDSSDADVKYSAQFLVSIVKPVCLTMLLVVAITRILDPTGDPLAPPSNAVQTTFALAYEEKASDSVQQKAQGSLLNAAYFIGMVVVITVVLVLLYKYRCMKIIYGYLMFSTFSLLFFTGGVLLGNFILHFNVTVDWLTFVFIMANFGALGSFAVFFTAPSIVKQAYLVCVSVIMAWSLSKLPDWTNWTILIALAVYDLFAVLSPCGPLKALVEMSQARNEPIPGLVYEADAPDDSEPSAVHPRSQNVHNEDSGEVLDEEPGVDSGARHLKSDVRLRLRGRGGGGGGDGGSSIEMHNVAAAEDVEAHHEVTPPEAGNLSSAQAAALTDASAAGAAAEQDEDEQRGVKLGLGDFVFYSVLVARAASTNLTVVVTTFVAIVFGLCSTLVLLNIFQKALPALPISIFLGIVVYFASAYGLAPMMAACTSRSFMA